MIRSLKQFYVSFFNWLVSFIPTNDFNDILIIRLDQLGDFVLWLDSAKEHRRIYNNKKLTLLVNANWYDLAKSLSYWDEVIPLDTIRFRINPWYRFNFLKFIRKEGFEIVICPRHSVKFTLEPSIVAISGANQKIVCEGSFPIEKQNYFTRSIAMRPNVHELSRNADFLRGLGRPHFKSTLPYLYIPKKNTLKYAVICPISFRKRKDWPMSRFIELMSKINIYGQMMCIVTSTIKIKHRLPDYVMDMSGDTQLMDFIECINNASIVIANDSAPIHLAAALNVPSVCIGAEKLGRFFPYEIDKPREGMILPRLIYKPKLKDITTSEVWGIIQEVLNENSHS